MTHPIMSTPNPVARIKSRLKELQVTSEAEFKLWEGKGDAIPADSLDRLEGWDREMKELLALYEEAKVKEDRMTSGRQNLQNIFAGNGGNAPVSDGDRTRSYKAGNAGDLATAIFDAGWSLHSNPSVTFNLKSTLPSAETYSPRNAQAILPTGQDSRFLFPWLRSEDIGNDTAVSDFRQSGDRTVTGTVQRALDAATDKAELDVTITAVTAEVVQVAIVIEDIPNSVLASMPMAEQFFSNELRFQINKAIDAHVLAAILAAAPPNSLTGADILTQIRNGIMSMRALGAQPDMVALNPADSASLDLLQDNENRYIFENGPQRIGTPVVWGLPVAEYSTGTSPVPMLIDSGRLGTLYMGAMSLEADPYSGFRKNLTNLRAEMSLLMFVRDANAVHLIEADA